MSASIFFGLPLGTMAWVSMAPNRILRGRLTVDKGLPKTEVARRGAEARRRLSSEGSDLSFALFTIVSVVGGLELASSTDEHTVLRLLGGLWALASIGMFVCLSSTIGRVSCCGDRHRPLL